MLRLSRRFAVKVASNGAPRVKGLRASAVWDFGLQGSRQGLRSFLAYGSKVQVRGSVLVGFGHPGRSVPAARPRKRPSGTTV